MAMAPALGGIDVELAMAGPVMLPSCQLGRRLAN